MNRRMTLNQTKKIQKLRVKARQDEADRIRRRLNADMDILSYMSSRYPVYPLPAYLKDYASPSVIEEYEKFTQRSSPEVQKAIQEVSDELDKLDDNPKPVWYKRLFKKD